MNVPNLLTLARLVLAFAFFALLWYAADLPKGEPGVYDRRTLLLDVSFFLFLVAAATDVLDGQLARRWNMVTDFGRVADPFVDKTVILGAFIFLIPMDALLEPWMVVLVLARETLVSGIRSFAESRGIAFPATAWGKAKMVVQSIAVGAAFVYLGHYRADLWPFVWIKPIYAAAIAATLVVTTVSGIMYVIQARKLLQKALEGAA